MPQNLLKKIEKHFIKTHHMQIVTAVELEFYLSGGKPEHDTELLANILKACTETSIPVDTLDAEQGERQFEIATAPLTSAHDGAMATDMIRKIITDEAKNVNCIAHFSAKTLEDQPASGLHLHISLHDEENGSNLFAKGHEADETELMVHAINGLCHTLNESMVFFAPTDNDYQRYVASTEGHCLTYAPTHVSWGGNNRTAAIRVPASTINPNQRHIEHRVPCPDCNPYLAFACIILGLDYGISEKLTTYPKIFGNAFDKQYDCTPLPKNFDAALDYYHDSHIIEQYISYEYINEDR